MTREEMVAALNKKCDEYASCSADENHVCPMWKSEEGCLMDNTPVESLYNSIFNNPNNQVHHPSHYNQGDIECIDAMVAAYGKEAVAHFCICNAFKYIWRTEHKNGMEDVDKANWYINKYKELKSVEVTQ